MPRESNALRSDRFWWGEWEGEEVRKVVAVFAAVAAIGLAVASFAQDAGPPVPGSPPTADRMAAILLGTTVAGKIVADLVRVIPAKWTNKIALACGVVTMVIANTKLLADAFIQNSGLAVTLHYDPGSAGQNAVALAGLGFGLPLLKIIVSTAIGLLQAPVLRWAHENGNKKVMPNLLKLHESDTA